MRINEDTTDSLTQEGEAAVAADIAVMKDKQKRILKRVSDIVPIHEDIIIIEKIDVMTYKSIIHVAEAGSQDRLRKSFYGKVLKVSPQDTFDDLKEEKKKNVKEGDIVQFNPDSGYSLNITIPEDMPEIWIISIDNILCIDTGFELDRVAKKTLISRKILDEARKRQVKEIGTAKKIIDNQQKENNIIPASR